VAARSQLRIDRLTFYRQDAEDALVHWTQSLAADEALEDLATLGRLLAIPGKFGGKNRTLAVQLARERGLLPA
jgi:hypothetical protein